MRSVKYILLLMLLLVSVSIADQASELFDMSLEELMDVDFVASASKKAEKLNEVPSNMVVVTDQQIKEWGVKNLREVLQRVAGYNVVADRDEWCFGARGNVSDNNQKYLVVLDGHRMYSINNFGPGNIIELPMDLSNIKRIEIIKGPGSVVWGNAAISGVISLYTKTPEDMDGKTVQLTAAAGSQDSYRGNFQVAKEVGWGDFMVSGAAAVSGGKEMMQSSATSNRPILETKTPDYPDPDGHPYGTYRTDLDRQDPGGMLHAKVKIKDKFSINGFYLENANFNRHYESNYGRSNYLTNQKYFLEGIYEDNIGGGDFTLKLSHHYNFAKYDNRQEVTGLPPAQLEIEWGDDNYNVAMAYQRDLYSETLTINAGIEYTHTNIHPVDKWEGPNANLSGQTMGPNTGAANVYPTATITYTPGTKYRDKNIFGYAIFDWYITPSFKLVGGTGMDYCNERGSDHLLYSPRAAAIWHVDKTATAKLVYNRAFLRPSTFQTGVQAEEMDQVELILMKQWDKIHVTATAFWQQLRGFINIVSIGSGYLNTGDYTSQGFELEAMTKLQENVDLWGNFSYVDATAKNFDASVPTNSIRTNPDGQVLSVPPFQFNLGGTFRYLDQKIFLSPALRFVGETEYRSSPPTSGDMSLKSASHSKIAPQTYLDVSLGYEPSDRLGIYLTCMNLTDVKTQNHLTIWNGTVGQYGRFVELKAILKF